VCQISVKDEDHNQQCCTHERAQMRKNGNQCVVLNMTDWLEPIKKGRPSSSRVSKTCVVAKKSERVQVTIGWRHLIRGWIAIQWGNMDDAHLPVVEPN
jgi:hypothetical protein